MGFINAHKLWRKPTQNTSDNDEIGGSRMAQGKSLTTVDVGGDVGAKFRYGQHDDFLASCFGAEWVNDTLTMGNSRITFHWQLTPLILVSHQSLVDVRLVECKLRPR